MSHDHKTHKLVMNTIKLVAKKAQTQDGAKVTAKQVSDAILSGDRTAFECFMMELWSNSANEKYVGMTYCDECQKYMLHE